MLHPAGWALGFVNLSTHLPHFRVFLIHEPSQTYNVSTTGNIPIRNLIPKVYGKLIAIDFDVTSKEREFSMKRLAGFEVLVAAFAEGLKSSGI